MSPAFHCRIYYDSRRQPLPEGCSDLAAPSSSAPLDSEEAVTSLAAVGGSARPLAIDLATDPEGAEQLVRLGISTERDLPAFALVEPGGKVRLLGLRLSGAEIARLAQGRGLPVDRLVVYSSSWCPDCRNAKRLLHESETAFDEVDIDQDPSAEALVLERSGGRRVVPTLRFGDRLWAFNPAPPLLRRLLESGAST